MIFYSIFSIMLLTAMLGGYFYYKDTQKRLVENADKLAKQEIVIQQQQAINEQINLDISKQNILRQQVNKSISQAQLNIETVRKQFSTHTDEVTGEVTTLSKAALAQPIIIERTINISTKDQFRCFEILSGSKLTPEEQNGQQINTICPDDFFKPIIVK
jgi:hypothetical protein